MQSQYRLYELPRVSLRCAKMPSALRATVRFVQQDAQRGVCEDGTTHRDDDAGRNHPHFLRSGVHGVQSSVESTFYDGLTREPRVAAERAGAARWLGQVYETFAHTADIGIRVQAENLPNLFADAGRALSSILVSNPDEIQPREQRTFCIGSANISQPDYVLVDWLSELLFAFESQRFLGCRFDITLDASGLKATAEGERVDENRHRLAHEVKGITYHGLKVEHAEGNWTAEVILDL